MSTTSTGSRVAVLALGALLSACASTPTQQASAPAPLGKRQAAQGADEGNRFIGPHGRIEAPFLRQIAELIVGCRSGISP